MEKATSRAERSITDALTTAKEVVAEIGEDRVELVTITAHWIAIHPASMPDGENIARDLGLDSALDHRMFVPGHTLWTGLRDGLEVQVRAELRRLTGATL